MEQIIIFAAGLVVGAVFSYLFLRANPNKKAVVDAWVKEQSKQV